MFACHSSDGSRCPKPTGGIISGPNLKRELNPHSLTPHKLFSKRESFSQYQDVCNSPEYLRYLPVAVAISVASEGAKIFEQQKKICKDPVFHCPRETDAVNADPTAGRFFLATFGVSVLHIYLTTTASLHAVFRFELLGGVKWGVWTRPT